MSGLLVLRCHEGDSSAFSELVGLWHQRLLDHARRLTGDTDAAQDVVQETWIAVVRGIQRLEDPDAFPAWVFRIATNKACDWVRRRSRSRKLHESFCAEEDAKGESTCVPEAHDALQHALEGIPVEDRALLNLHYLEGFSTREIARILDIPQGTVKSRMHHARERVKRRMEDIENE